MTDENKDGDVKPEEAAKNDDAPKKEGPSKMPDLKEIGSMAGKLFHDVKKSIGEIITDYKAKRPAEPAAAADKKEEKSETDVVAEEAAASTAAQEEAPAPEETAAPEENEEKKDG